MAQLSTNSAQQLRKQFIDEHLTRLRGLGSAAELDDIVGSILMGDTIISLDYQDLHTLALDASSIDCVRVEAPRDSYGAPLADAIGALLAAHTGETITGILLFIEWDDAKPLAMDAFASLSAALQTLDAHTDVRWSAAPVREGAPFDMRISLLASFN